MVIICKKKQTNSNFCNKNADTIIQIKFTLKKDETNHIIIFGNDFGLPQFKRTEHEQESTCGLFLRHRHHSYRG